MTRLRWRLLHPRTYRTALWTARFWKRTRHLTVDAITTGRPATPPTTAPNNRWVVEAVLGRLGATCLSRSVVLQTWDLHHGEARDLVIGVRGGTRNFEAHAWLDGEDAHGADGFAELLRRPAKRLTDG